MMALGRIALAVLLGIIFVLDAGTGRAQAAEDGMQDYLKCPMSSEIKDVGAAMAWWNRRSPEQQRIILALPCEERFVPLVCVFLYDPDLVGCTNKGLAEFRANKACETKGYDLLSQEMADCKQKYKKDLKNPFSATS